MRFRLAGAAVALVAALASAPGLWTLSGGDPDGEWVLVTHVIDGDTIRVGRGWRQTTVRLVGVDTPETVHPNKPVQYYGPEASAFTGRSLEGRRVRLQVKPLERRDHYGRLLAYVVLEDGTLFNRELVRLGYARALTRYPFRHRQSFVEAEAEAKRSRRGLWAEPATTGRIVGNRRSHIYHLPHHLHYDDVGESNRVYFDSEEQAREAGYRRARR